MGAQKSIHACGAKIDLNLDLTNKICAALLLPPQFQEADSPFSYVEGRVGLQHPNVFGGGETLDAVWDKGLCDSNVVIALRQPRPGWLSKQTFIVQISTTPEIAVHGEPLDCYSRTRSVGINLRRYSAGVELSEPAISNWSMTTGIKFEHVRPTNDDGFPVAMDNEGFPITCSGNSHDSMVVLRQQSEYTTANDHGFFKSAFQIEQGVTMLPKLLIFNRFKFNVSRGVKLGKSLLLTRITGGSIVGDMAPYQAFSVGGLESVRGYGDGAVGSGRSCLIVNSDLAIPLMKDWEGVAFMDYGSDLGSAHHVPGNPALRHGKPGSGFSYGYGLRLNSQRVQFRLDYATNAFNRTTLYFGVTNLTSPT